MYKFRNDRQITLFDFNQFCGARLDPENEWIAIAEIIPWERAELKYAEMFSRSTGHPAVPFRQVFGAAVIQARCRLSERKLFKVIAEDPHLQCFIGLRSFSENIPFSPSALRAFKSRMDIRFLSYVNEMIAEETGFDAGNESAILLRKCALSDRAVEITDRIISRLHRDHRPWKKPRSCRNTARKEYLSVARSKSRSVSRMELLVRKNSVRTMRNLEEIGKYVQSGYCITGQEKLAADAACGFCTAHGLENESGPEVVSLKDTFLSARDGRIPEGLYVYKDRSGYAHISEPFWPYVPETVFSDAAERYYCVFGRYPGCVRTEGPLVSKENMSFCKKHRIAFSELTAEAEGSGTGGTWETVKDGEALICCSGPGKTDLVKEAMDVIVSNLFEDGALGFRACYHMVTGSDEGTFRIIYGD
ncbi:MAG: transposase [Clostridia bacterium]|nr:transposase [Clostridia bacterium]